MFEMRQLCCTKFMHLETAQLNVLIALKAEEDPDCLPILGEYETFELKGVDLASIGRFIESGCARCHIPKELGSCAISDRLAEIRESAITAQAGMVIKDTSPQPFRTNYHNSVSQPSLGGTNRGMRR